MSEAKHTPGPWRLHPTDDCIVIDADRNEVASVCGDYNQPETWPIMEANARLITAAPDLLSALKLFFEEHDNTYDGEPMSGEMAIFLEKGRAAIAKAEGRE